MTPNSKYRPEIDGLRALAVLPVLFFHLGLGFTGGFTGVDVFFVISGFLICGIILRESDESRFSMLRFYERRVRRILPAFFVVAFVAIMLGALVLYPGDFDLMGNHLSFISLFASNVYLSIFEGGYWTGDAKMFPLLHTWSLAVEEQFYFVMPVILLVLHRRLKKQLFGALAFLFSVSLFYCIYATQVIPEKAFYLLPSRGWEMLMGGMVYLLVQRDCPWKEHALIGKILGGVGLLLIIGSYFTITGAMAFPGYIALFPTLGTALFIYSNSWGTNWSGRLLTWAPVVFVGKISYSLYLWHWPLIIFFKAHRYPEDLVLYDKILLFVVSLVASVLTWKFVEQPFRHPAKRHSPLKAIVPACILLVLLFGVSLAIRKYDGFQGRLPWVAGEVVARVKFEQDALGFERLSGIFNAKDQFQSGGYQVGVQGGQSPRIVVIGDSHAGMYSEKLSRFSLDYGFPISFFTNSGYKPLVQDNIEEDQLIFEYLSEWKPSVIIFIIKTEYLFGAPSEKDKYKDLYKDAIYRLSRICEDFYFVLQTPRSTAFNIRGWANDSTIRLIDLLINDGATDLPRLREEPAISRSSRAQARAWVEGFGIPNLEILDPGDYLLENGQTVITDQGRLLYWDGDHVNNLGAELVSPLFQEIFEGLASETEPNSSSE